MMRTRLLQFISLLVLLLLLGISLQDIKAQGGGEVSPTIAIIDIDEKSIAALGRWPWPRDTHALLLKRLASQNIKAIVFDILFSEPESERPERDQTFARAMKESGNVYVAMAFLTAEGGEIPKPSPRTPLIEAWRIGKLQAPTLTLKAPLLRDALLPVKSLAESAKGVGFVNIFPPSNLPMTKAPLILAYLDSFYPSLPLRIALDLCHSPSDLQELLNPQGSIKLGSRTIRSEEGEFTLEFPKRSLPLYRHYSYIDLIRSPDMSIEGNIVIIGARAIGLGDHYVTPAALYTPGPEIIAAAIDTLVKGCL